MGAKGQSLGRAISKTVLLLVVAMLAVVAGAVPGTRAGAASKTPPGDPPGNNGTIKIKRSDPTADPNEQRNANQPHIDGCVVWLSFIGFDQAQTADVTFTAHPPSGTGQVLVADKSVAISPDPAGGGQDQDVVIAYNLTSAVQGLKHQKNQGYHIKVTSDTREAPGGAKQKVFWIDCAPAAPTTLRISKAMQGPAGPTGFGFTVSCNHRPLDTKFTLDAGKSKDITGVPPGTTCAVAETDPKGAQGRTASEEPADSVANDGVVKVGTTPAVVTYTNVFPGEGSTPAPDNADLRGPTGGPSTAAQTAAGTAVLGETATRPEAAATLPRTGQDPRPLASTGLLSLIAGVALLAALAGRRS